jgi:uncharacterized surface protein with fasciclin (FAS1) repeats
MNITRILSYTKHALLVLAMLTIVGISGCDDDDEGPKIYDGTILELLSDPQYKQASGADASVALDSLVKYLSLYPSLTAKLSGSAEYTYFAPSNSAFIGLLGIPNFPQDIRLISPAVVENVLTYHAVAGKKMKADLTAGTVLTTDFTDPLSPAAPQKITVNANGTLIAAPNSANIDIDIVKADIQTENGVVHITESVLIPPSVGAVLTPILGTMAATVLLGKDFTNLAKIIMAADAGFTENATNLQFKVSTWLAMPITSATLTTANQKGFTFFAPPNAISATTTVLTEATANAIIATADKGRGFLLNHLVISGQYTVSDPPTTNPNQISKFTNGQTLVPVSGAAKTIAISVGTPSASNPYGVAASNTPATVSSFRPIVKKDIIHTNGQVQVFAGVLQ